VLDAPQDDGGSDVGFWSYTIMQGKIFEWSSWESENCCLEIWMAKVWNGKFHSHVLFVYACKFSLKGIMKL